MKKAARNISSLLSAMMVSADSNQGNPVPVVGATPVTVSRGWYAAPWIWVVGAGVFVLILFMFDKGRRRRTH